MHHRIDTLDQTLRSHYCVLYERQKLRGKAPSTKRHYFYALRYFDQHLRRPALLTDLNDDEVGAAMSYIVAPDGLCLGPRSANKFRDCILALWRFLARKGIVDRWPDVEPITEPVRIPVAWSKSQLAALFAACQRQTGTIGSVPANLWWHGLHAVAWDSAERITAAVSIETSDLDLANGWLLVRAELRKGKTEDKLTRLHPDTVKALRGIVSPNRDRVFPWPYTATYLWNRYDRLLRLAGLPHDRQHKFHCLRKSAASWYELAGGNATALLGHSSRKVTEKYLDPRIVKAQHAADLLFRPGET